MHRSQTIDATHHKGIPITTPARTLIDLAGQLDYHTLRRTVREAQRQLVTIPQILQTLDRLGPRPGIANLTKILATGHAPTRSELEDAVLDLLLNAGFQHPARQPPTQHQRPQADPRLQMATTTPGHRGRRRAWHDNRLTREDDAEKQAILEAHGERVIRITWAQAIAHRTQTLTRIKAAGAPT